MIWVNWRTTRFEVDCRAEANYNMWPNAKYNGKDEIVKLPKEMQTRGSFTIRTFNQQGELVTLSQEETARCFQEVLDKRNEEAPRRVSPESQKSNNR